MGSRTKVVHLVEGGPAAIREPRLDPDVSSVVTLAAVAVAYDVEPKISSAFQIIGGRLTSG